MNLTTIYFERVSSWRTEVVFIALASLFVGLLGWCQASGMADLWSILFSGAFAFFLFCSLNYRTLAIRLTDEQLHLRFGVFRWTIALDNVAACEPDTTSLWRIGGAGVHFSLFSGRYRAMFNFLEHPRLVIALTQKRGPVRDVAFSTRNPEELARLIMIRSSDKAR